MLNHVPTVGAVAALGLLLLGYVRRNEHLKHVGLEVLFMVALLTLPVYMSGVAAYCEMRDAAGVSDIAMRIHQDVALFGFSWMEFAGFVAWIALWQSRRHGRAGTRARPGRDAAAGAVACRSWARGESWRRDSPSGDPSGPSVARHAPARRARTIRGGGDLPGSWSTAHWAWPAGETVHFLGLSLSIGVLLAINLRILGVMRQVPFARHCTGCCRGACSASAPISSPACCSSSDSQGSTSDNAPFYWKVVFLMIAGANFLYLTVFRKAWVGDEGGFDLADKAMAVSSIVAWLADPLRGPDAAFPRQRLLTLKKSFGLRTRLGELADFDYRVSLGRGLLWLCRNTRRSRRRWWRGRNFYGSDGDFHSFANVTLQAFTIDSLLADARDRL